MWLCVTVIQKTHGSVVWSFSLERSHHRNLKVGGSSGICELEKRICVATIPEQRLPCELLVMSWSRWIPVLVFLSQRTEW